MLNLESCFHLPLALSGWLGKNKNLFFTYQKASSDGVTASESVTLDAASIAETPSLFLSSSDSPMKCVVVQPDASVLLVGTLLCDTSPIA